MSVENYINAYQDDRSPLTSQDIVKGINGMMLESAELIEKKNADTPHTFKHLASLLAEEKMKTMSADEMRSIATMKRKISYKEEKG